MTYCCVLGEDSKLGVIARVDIDGCWWRVNAFP